jgi:hypothetical protein
VIRRLSVTAVVLLSCVAAERLGAQSADEPDSSYHIARRIRVGGNGFWDYLVYDAPRHRLFLSHGTQVDVVDEESGAVVGHIPDTPGVHGIALAPDLGRGFTSNGQDNSVTVFDLATLAGIARIRVPGRNPDAIVYDTVTRRVFTFDGGSDDATAIDAAADSVIGRLDLGGKPEYAVSDGEGGVLVNIEDKSEVVGFDARSLTIRSRWPLPGCKEPSALALDREHGRLFSGCRNGRLMVLDAGTGRPVAWAPIGDGVDGGGYDPGTGLAFASAGDGSLTVVREDAPDRVHVVTRVGTQRGARTMALDSVTHRVFVVTASFGPAPAPTHDRPHPRPAIVPGSFTLLVIEP